MSKLGSLASLASSAGSFLPGPIGTISQVISAVQGAKNLFGGDKQKTPSAPAPAQETPFVPKKPTAIARPDSLSGLTGYDPAQERSALATKGVNTGLGKDETTYYKNLVSRSLISDDNKVVDDPNALLPIESQYFSRQGMDTSNITNLLKAIMGG